MSVNMSERVKRMLGKPEGLDLDFKVNAKVEAEDFVAFANSPRGGTLLLGVEEVTINGVQQGRVVGCKVDDEARLAIVNKAAQCTPPVSVKVEIEWDDDKAFFVVDIPSGPDKPYCTPNGTYKVRGDGRNLTLAPANLLNMLLEQESDRFLSRFREATSDLERGVCELRGRLSETTNELAESIDRLQTLTEEKLDHISFLADGANAGSLSAPVSSEEVLRELGAAVRLAGSVQRIESRLDQLDARVASLVQKT